MGTIGTTGITVAVVAIIFIAVIRRPPDRGDGFEVTVDTGTAPKRKWHGGLVFKNGAAVSFGADQVLASPWKIINIRLKGDLSVAVI